MAAQADLHVPSLLLLTEKGGKYWKGTVAHMA